MSRSRELRDDAHVTSFTRSSSPSLSAGMMLGAAVVMMALTLLLAFMTWIQTRDLQSSQDARFAGVENRLAQLSTKVEQVSARAAPPQRGPDPNRLYTVKTDGAPIRGTKDAPITIVEFSDFQ
jgi:protein-disulfide isomerase